MTKKNWKVGKKVFRTEQEASQFSKDLMKLGAFGGWSPTDEEVTHRYMGNMRTEVVA